MQGIVSAHWDGWWARRMGAHMDIFPNVELGLLLKQGSHQSSGHENTSSAQKHKRVQGNKAHVCFSSLHVPIKASNYNGFFSDSGDQIVAIICANFWWGGIPCIHGCTVDNNLSPRPGSLHNQSSVRPTLQKKLMISNEAPHNDPCRAKKKKVQDAELTHTHTHIYIHMHAHVWFVSDNQWILWIGENKRYAQQHELQ